MDKYFKMTTGSKLICYYDKACSLILFDMRVYNISKPKIYKIDVYDEEGHNIDSFYNNKKETKKLLKNWYSLNPIFYEIFEAKNIELNPDGTLRDLSLYEKLKSLTKKSSSAPSSVFSSPRNVNSVSSSPRNFKPLTPRDVIVPSISRNITPRSSSSSSSSTPRSVTTTPRSL